MARLSKSQQFAIYEDVAADQLSFDGDVEEHRDEDKEELGRLGHAPDGAHVKSHVVEYTTEEEPDADDEARGVSAYTRTSVSSLPESTWQTDTEGDHAPVQKDYTPPVIRPSFRRPESVQRMQMTSPPPFSSRSPRLRPGTPVARGSPRPRRRRISEKKEYPLVLLHITLLPVHLPQDLLPEDVLDSLRLLRSKVTETVLQRGLLIPHPREDYELLEERVLEALELREERVTKCGHYRTQRDSTSSMGSDSGLGSSISGSEVEVCTTCQHSLKSSHSGVVAGGRRWSVKVYAANGLMRAPAWAAAWSEMEGVDVEVRPWMSDELAAMVEEGRIREEEARARQEEVERWHEKEEMASMEHGQMLLLAPEQMAPPFSADHQESETLIRSEPLAKSQDELPQVYRPSQIPLQVLLKNYFFLLAQDRRNVAIFFLGLLALWFSMSNVWSPLRTTTGLAEMPSAQVEPAASLLDTTQGAVMNVVEGAGALLENLGDGIGSLSDIAAEILPQQDDTLLEVFDEHKVVDLEQLKADEQKSGTDSGLDIEQNMSEANQAYLEHSTREA